ncbi:MAG: hypothetical protein NTW59_04475 [Candidatus Diapherotrites archaeon]|nr:hypothetical protein [Candidatus Diapherotrites archaeon]
MGNGNGEKKLKFLFVSHSALANDLAWEIKNEGNEAKFFIESASDKNVGIWRR